METNIKSIVSAKADKAKSKCSCVPSHGVDFTLIPGREGSNGVRWRCRTNRETRCRECDNQAELIRLQPSLEGACGPVPGQFV